MTQFDETRAVHAGRGDLSKRGVHVPTVDRSTTYPISSLDDAFESMEALSEGRAPEGNSIYRRLHNPTVAGFEEAFSELEKTDGAVAFGSGMAAITATLLAAKEEGHHVVAVRPLYGGTDQLLSSGMLGVEVTWAKPDEVEEAVGPSTSLVIAETPANPTLSVVDIADIADQAGDVPVMIDSTFATPVLQNPVDCGADLAVHSATKFIGGHGDLVGGVVAGDESWLRRLRRVRGATGGLMTPESAYRFHRGLQTLVLRVRTAQEGAKFLVSRLCEHPVVDAVHYPGFNSPEQRAIVDRQMEGPGAVLSFEIEGGFERAKAIMESVEVMTPAVSLGSTDTLIQYPAGLTHRKVDPQVRAELGITDGLLRISVGLEHPDDLWTDLRAALDQSLDQ